MDKYDTSQLTEFPRYEAESTQSGVSTFFNKLWKFPIFTPSESSEIVQDKSPTLVKQNAQMSDEQKQDCDDSKTETGSYAVEFEGRSLPNVLRRISSLIALGSGGQGTRYADTELARYWMPDDISRECYECALRFSTLRRRHHCRVCGQIFCSRCCSQRVPGQIFGCAGGLRVCNYCCNVVLSYLKENDMTSEISPDLRTLQENLQVKFPENRSNSSKSRDSFMFARQQEERCEPRPTPTEALLDLYRQLVAALPQQQHRYRLVRYNGVWRGNDILQWVMDNTNYKTRFQASQVCQNLLSSGYMECVSELLQFADYALYRPTALPALSQDESSPPEEEGRLHESVSSYCLDLNLGNSSARLIKAPKQETRPSPPSEEDSNPVLEQSEGLAAPRKVCKALLEAGEDHLRLLLRQCLARESLPASWLPVLAALCQQAADIVMPDLFSSDIDIRNYVQVKKVSGGSLRDSCVVHGVVLTKNVAHRGMPQQISNPTVLLLDCSIAYQRVEGKLTSLEPVLLQEEQYLMRCAARIAALQPRVVLVRGSAARAVQDSLREAGRALATRLRDRALARCARCTRADLVSSIDARIGTPRLGTAEKFYVKNFPNKTLMVLEGCAEPNLGCCILLRGASLQELIRVKKVVKFMLLACYNWRLEKAFLGDIEAILPEPGMTFDDDCENVNDDTNEMPIDREDTDASDTVMSNDDWEATIAASKSKESTRPDSANSVEVKTVSEFNKRVSEPDDPLQRTKPFRKVDSEKNFSCGVPIRDFSDPLRATLDDDVFLPKEEAKLKADNHTERWCTDDVVLSMSPITVIPAPYLETEAGRKCPLRQYFPQPLLKVPNRAPHTPKQLHRKISKPQQNDVELKEVHPFIREPLTASAEDLRVRASLAHYRATGGRYRPDKHKHECPLYKPCVVKRSQKEPSPEVEKITEDQQLDPLAPEQHQRLSMLIYSYCAKSANVPDFCVNPWIVTMELYGKHDISLGAFLEKYCFNPDYKCPSTSCQVPMNQHVRRFVHGDVCLTVTCNTIGHSNVDKIKEDQNKQVMFWSRCEVCGASGRARALSPAALSWSLGAYLHARALGGRPALRAPACPHALHAHAHAFARRLTTACVRYSKISTHDIKLPPKVIATNYDTKKMREALIQQLNDLMLKGHETFSGLTDSEAEKEQQNFKQHCDQILCALTSGNLQEHTSLAGVVRSLWNVSDRIISGEKMLRDAQDKWAAPQRHNNKPQPETAVEEKSDLEDSAGESANDSSGTEEDEEKGDKKTVRQILSQLLSNNQPSNQVGIIISSGVLPVVVCAGDIGSVIAATLASITYQRTMRQQRQSTQTEPDETETVPAKEKTEGDKTKAAKSNDHIEVLLKDGLLCRVYYAPQFQKLRHMLLAPLSNNQNITDEFLTTPLEHSTNDVKCCSDDKDKTDGKSLCEIEEGFIRSLAHCVPWAARGGKSGSTFCKTKDDRYVLKEMTKPEWQQFLEFAPHYFNYVINCHQNNLPSLLARIVGVYSVGGAGNGILVMENVWYGCGTNTTRFDLKGSSRHRLATDTPVLMDENLLHLRWERPLYVLWHAGAVVWSCIERDTNFLAGHAVMDYSLLLGVDGDALVLGLIDYIRTFTWDKKLEHLVKKNLGSGQPTVVSPDEYKRRFCAAARKYFLQCPGHWDHLYDILDKSA
ncbi:unnamed protein product [Chilo suppressalis]|uniref:1-phosphatidylinositol-3-phosphate 5-kinase n=1 Tax=Chilo suppressalis TaxID=168631 RepID=A0ABN8L561_CHISP|nr:unnamed protein product [Chilo suppressalis]